MTLDTKLIGEVLNSKPMEKVYDDGLSVPLKETSKLVTYFIKTAQFLCAPFQYIAACQERLEKRLKVAIEQVPEEKRIEPPSSILIPIVNHLSYVEDGNLLAELYQNLLARAMDKTRNSEAHPGFIVTISQLSPDEALFLYELNFKQFSFTKVWDYDRQTNRFSFVQMVDNEFPLNKLIFANNFDMYIGHLEKLELICVVNKKSEPIWQDENKKNQIGGRETYTMGFTKFGELFVKACLPNNRA